MVGAIYLQWFRTNYDRREMIFARMRDKQDTKHLHKQAANNNNNNPA
jgi:hypothetical protein